MPNAFFDWPHDIVGWLGLLSLVIVGASAAYGNFDLNRKKRREEVNDLNQEVIESLEKKIGILSEDLGKAQTEIDKLRKEVAVVTAENLTMKEIFQGRDKTTIDYQAKGLAAMEMNKQMYATIVESNENVTRLLGLMERHLQVVESRNTPPKLKNR